MVNINGRRALGDYWSSAYGTTAPLSQRYALYCASRQGSSRFALRAYCQMDQLIIGSVLDKTVYTFFAC